MAKSKRALLIPNEIRRNMQGIHAIARNSRFNLCNLNRLSLDCRSLIQCHSSNVPEIQNVRESVKLRWQNVAKACSFNSTRSPNMCGNSQKREFSRRRACASSRPNPRVTTATYSSTGSTQRNSGRYCKRSDIRLRIASKGSKTRYLSAIHDRPHISEVNNTP